MEIDEFEKLMGIKLYPHQRQWLEAIDKGNYVLKIGPRNTEKKYLHRLALALDVARHLEKGETMTIMCVTEELAKEVFDWIVKNFGKHKNLQDV